MSCPPRQSLPSADNTGGTIPYADWREAVDPERPFERFDPLAQLAYGLAGGAGGMLCCGCLSLPAFLAAYKLTGKNLFLRRVRRLRDDPSYHIQVACRLLLERGGLAYGRDEGLLSILDGGILFEGRRTSFSIPIEEGREVQISRSGVDFCFPTPGGPCRAVLFSAEESEMAMLARDRFRDDSPPSDTIVFPPCVPDRAAWQRVVTFECLSWGLGVAGVVFGLAWSAVVDPTAALSAAVTIPGLAAIGVVNARGRRRRLERLQDAALPPKA